VANKFRALWGEEAGWAQSVLFTANLRSFSERLVEKSESVKVEVKQEKDETVLTEIKTETKTTVKRAKRGAGGLEHQVIKVEETTQRRSKRSRR
jgi:N-glycosylase/DNA lyase